MGCTMKLSAACVKLCGDLWNGRGLFARLAEAPRWRVLLVECAVLAVACGGFYLMRYEASAASYRKALSRMSNELTGVVLELEVERRDLDAACARRDVLAGFVLDKESQARQLAGITGSDVLQGLELVSMSPQPKENLEQYARCRILLTVEGAFGDFVRFLRRLESSAVACSIIEMDVAATGDDKRRRERISFLVETYTNADPPDRANGVRP